MSWDVGRFLATGSLVNAFANQKQIWTKIDLVKTHKGAVCLDGSSAVIYFKLGSQLNMNKWVVHLEGGGWCYDLPGCYHRAATKYGTTVFDVDQSSGLASFDMLNTDAIRNPDFWDWTSIFIRYCDGGSFSGHVEEPIVYNGTKLYFRGFDILSAAFDVMLAGHASLAGAKVSLSHATNLILSGNSAGGLASILHADYVSSRLSSHTDFRTVAQVGFFIDGLSIYGENSMTDVFMNIAVIQNISSGGGHQVNELCFASTPPLMRWKCFMAEYTVPFVTSPIFIQNSRNDDWQLRNILSLKVVSCNPERCNHVHDPDMLSCVENLKSSCSADQLNSVTQFADEFNAHLLSSNVISSTGNRNGGLITSCDLHEHMIHDGWNTIHVHHRSMRSWITDWVFDVPGSAAVVHDVKWPLNPTCKSAHFVPQSGPTKEGVGNGKSND